jgi:hypothetical protein
MWSSETDLVPINSTFLQAALAAETHLARQFLLE